MGRSIWLKCLKSAWQPSARTRTQCSRAILAALFTTLFMAFIAGPALAQSGPGLPPPPDVNVTDQFGWNLTTGWWEAPTASVHIGPQGRLGLSFTYMMGMSGQINSYDTTIKHAWDSDHVIVTVMGRNEEFFPWGSAWISYTGDGGTLTHSGSTWTYTDKFGAVTQFNNFGGGSFWITDALGSTTTYPDGLVISYTWRTYGGGFAIASINNSLGYQIKFNFSCSSGSSGLCYFIYTKVIALNNAVEWCNPTAQTCTPTNSWPTITLGSGTATDSMGHVWTLTETASGCCGYFSMTDDFELPTGQHIMHYWSIDPSGQVSNQSTVVGTNTWTYNIDTTTNAPAVNGTVTDPNGVVRQVDTDGPTGLPADDILDPGGSGHINSAKYYTWNNPNQLASVTDRDSSNSSYGYDGTTNILGYVSKQGTGNSLSTSASFSQTCNSSSVSYGPNPTSITDGNGYCTDYTYNGHGNVTSIEGPPPSSGADRPYTTYTWTAHYAWYLTSSSSTLVQGPAIYLPDEIDTCVTTRTSCSGSGEKKTLFTYESGSSSVGSNLNTLTVTNEIDGATCPSSDCSTITNTYDMYGNVSSVSTPNSTSNKTVYFYDADRRQVGVVQPVSGGGGTSNYAATKTTYDDFNRVLEVEQGYTISQSRYDFDNNFTSMVQTTSTYDSTTGALIKTVGSIGGTAQSVTQYSYDAGGRLTCTAVRQNSSVFGSLPSDACTQSTTGSNGYDLISENNYDAANRITSVDSGVGSGSSITSLTNHYDSSGRLDWVEDAKGNRSGYTYNGDNRLSQLNFPDPSTTHTISSTDYEGYSYDTVGNLTTKRLRSSDTFTMHYDGLERLYRREDPASSSNDIYYTYDLVNNLLSVCRCSSGTPDVSFTWDALSRKTGETSSGHTLSSQYDAAGNRTRLTYPDSNYIDYSYDLLGRMYQVKENGSTVLAQYAYDDLGRTTGITRSNSTSTSASYGGSSQSWSLSQDLASTGQDVTLSMDYSPAGQMSQRAINNSSYRYQNTANATTNYCPNGLNQYATVGGSSGSCSGGQTYSYDARGNLTSDGSRSFGYDYDNELTCVGSSCATMSLSYDPAGRLHSTTASSTTENYVYDGSSLVVEYDGSGNILRRYVPGQSADETLVWYEGSGLSTPYQLHTDEQGSVIAASNGSGVGTLYAYSATGEPQGGFSGGAPIFRYTGQAQLASAGLYYYKARVYDPALGRFLQTDPDGYAQGLNMYAYVMNNYPNTTDASGREGEGEGYKCWQGNTWDFEAECGGGSDDIETVLSRGKRDPNCWMLSCGDFRVTPIDLSNNPLAGLGLGNDPFSNQPTRKQDQPKGPSCDPGYVDALTVGYRLGGAFQVAGSVSLLAAGVLAKIPGGQGASVAFGAVGIGFSGIGIGLQGATGYYIGKQTGDYTLFKGSVIGGVLAALPTSPITGYAAGGVANMITGNRRSYCP